MNRPIFKQVFYALIILAVLSGCSGSPTALLPTKETPLSPSITATSVSAEPTTGPSPSANQTSTGYWPNPDWRTSTPEQQGMDSAQISKVFDAIQRANQPVHSLVIIRNGYVVTEAYYPPFRAEARHSLNSSTESVVSILVGIAIQEGYIKGLDQKMVDFFPDRKIANLDARKQIVTIKDLLTHTSGLSVYDGLGDSDNWVQTVMDVPMETDPGKVWNNNWGGYLLLSAIIQKATGMTALAFANKVLFEPLGISGAGWLTDPQGINNGGSLLYLTSRDMAKIGYLYLNNGEWNGKQVVPKEYVLASTTHQIDVPFRSGWGYGYGWYVAPNGSYDSESWGGQLTYVKPEQGIVTVFTGDASQDDYSNIEADIFADTFVDPIIVPAVKSAGVLPENPASAALLKDQITTLEKPASQPIQPLPYIAQTISGKRYLLDDGEAFTLTFAGDQTKLDWSLKDQSMHFPIGMDNGFLTTPFDQTENLSLFGATQRALGPIFLALRGSWIAVDTFKLTMQFLNSGSRHTVTFKFAEDKVTMIHSETALSNIIYLKGQVQGLTSTTTTRIQSLLAKPPSVLKASLPAARSEAKGQIVFFAWDGSHLQIFIEKADGSDVRQLVKSQDDDSSPVLSADGRMVLFNRSITDSAGVWQSQQLYMVNVDGTNLHPLDPGGCVLPCFAESFDGHALSHDGTQIVFNRPLVDSTGKPDSNGGFASFGLWVMKTDGSGLHQVTQMQLNSGESDENAGWSPDGKRLVFQRNTSQGFAIFTVATDGSNPQQLTPWEMDANDPAWSPDGRLIAFCAICDYGVGERNIYTIHPDGTGLTRLTSNLSKTTDGSMATFHPSWSPNGRQILFSHYPSGGSTDLFVMNRDGSDLHVLAHTDLNEQTADWGISPKPKFKN